ncbi:DUF4269 domain-containing protein [Hymenobacter setariae]|uniref:DUF4269 domain-containing protein n=1 Tax=Hymenobacter setariae TaxID=2594794 RepID=A0A558BZP4_9BACT|nr:DUF4269 domain-containing protein [Hymenobacter setariae]
MLQELGILTTLGVFDPVIAGTIPLGIDLPTSDIDIICELSPATGPAFEHLLCSHYGHLPAFRIGTSSSSKIPAMISSFRYLETEIEVFGQALPTGQQYAFRHLVVEHAVLHAGGPAWHTAVRRLKAQGLKTEPAFAGLLQLPGDPYEALLTLENLSATELAARLAQITLPSSQH